MLEKLTLQTQTPKPSTSNPPTPPCQGGFDLGKLPNLQAQPPKPPLSGGFKTNPPFPPYQGGF